MFFLIFEAMSKRKRALDREAGLVFSWRTRDRSQGRVMVAVVVSGAFWLLLLGMVRVVPLHGEARIERGVDLTVVNLNEDKNRWLDEIVKRDVPFPSRWQLLPAPTTEAWIENAVALVEPPQYVAKYPEIDDPRVDNGLDLQSILGRWPLPEAERVARGEIGAQGSLAIRWRIATGEKVVFSWALPMMDDFSVGKQFRFYVSVDAAGGVREALLLEGGFADSRETGDFLRRKMAGEVFLEEFGKEEARWLFLEGEVVAGGTR